MTKTSIKRKFPVYVVKLKICLCSPQKSAPRLDKCTLLKHFVFETYLPNTEACAHSQGSSVWLQAGYAASLDSFMHQQLPER